MQVWHENKLTFAHTKDLEEWKSTNTVNTVSTVNHNTENPS